MAVKGDWTLVRRNSCAGQAPFEGSFSSAVHLPETRHQKKYLLDLTASGFSSRTFLGDLNRSMQHCGAARHCRHSLRLRQVVRSQQSMPKLWFFEAVTNVQNGSLESELGGSNDYE